MSDSVAVDMLETPQSSQEEVIGSRCWRSCSIISSILKKVLVKIGYKPKQIKLVHLFSRR